MWGIPPQRSAVLLRSLRDTNMYMYIYAYMNTWMYVFKYISPHAVYSRSTHTFLHARTCTHMHAHARTCTPARKTHPSHTLTSLLAQVGKTPFDLVCDAPTGAAFAEHTVITDDNKNALLLLCARFGIASRVPALLQAGANAVHPHQVAHPIRQAACWEHAI